jgi:hypothetical protein
MESSVYKQLTSTDKELLATLWGTQTIKSVGNAIDKYQQLKAAHIAMNAPDFANVLVNRGNIEGARFIYDLCKLAHSKQKKD